MVLQWIDNVIGTGPNRRSLRHAVTLIIWISFTTIKLNTFSLLYGGDWSKSKNLQICINKIKGDSGQIRESSSTFWSMLPGFCRHQTINRPIWKSNQLKNPVQVVFRLSDHDRSCHTIQKMLKLYSKRTFYVIFSKVQHDRLSPVHLNSRQKLRH